VKGIGKLLTVGQCIVGSCMVSGAELILLWDSMGRELLVSERN